MQKLSDSLRLSFVPDSLKSRFSEITTYNELYDTLFRTLEDTDALEDLKVDLSDVRLPNQIDAETFIEKAHRWARDRRNISDEAFMDSISTNISGEGGNFGILSQMDTGHFNQQVRKVFENDEGFKGFVLGNLPLMMFILIPLFAGVLKFIYVRRKHLYIKHVIHALHVHAFAYFVYGIALLILFKLITPEVFPNIDHAQWRGILAFIFFVGVSTYVFVSFKKVYQQHWFKTLLKFNIVGIIYGFFLNTFFAIELFISFWYY